MSRKGKITVTWIKEQHTDQDIATLRRKAERGSTKLEVEAGRKK
jgi:hypothetical protein